MVIFLIGMMGSGKTTVGKLLSFQLKLPFIDLDEEIIKMEGKTINEIFEFKGEGYFRFLETKILKNIKNSICACGGGVVLNKNNLEFINSKGMTVFLKTEIKELSRRLNYFSDRPLLLNENKKEQLEEIWEERKRIYFKSADLIVKTDNKSPLEIVEEIKNKMIL